MSKGGKGFKLDFYKLFDSGLKPDDLPSFGLHRSSIDRYFREYRQNRGFREITTDSGRQKAKNKSATQQLEFIRELQDKNVSLAAQLGAATERVHNLESQVKLLTAPKKPWWRRIFKL